MLSAEIKFATNSVKYISQFIIGKLSPSFFSLFILCAFGGSLIANAQSDQSNVKFTEGNFNDSGALSLTVPLGKYKGRGLDLPVALNYSSDVWKIEHLGKVPRQVPGYSCCITQSVTEAIYAKHSASGWRSSLALPIIEYPKTNAGYDYQGKSYEVPSGTGAGCFNYRIREVYIHMPDGASYTLRKSDQPSNSPNSVDMSGTFYAIDGSRIRFDANGSGDTGTIYMPDGTVYVLGHPTSTITDRNGNTMTYNETTRQWTDTLGREIVNPLPAAPQVGDFDYFLPGLAGVDNGQIKYTFKWKKLENALTPVNGSTPALRVIGSEVLPYPNSPPASGNMPEPESSQYEPLFKSTPLGYTESGARVGTQIVGKGEDIGGGQLFNPVVLTEIVLPDGSSYKYSYNVYGEIDKVIYPTNAYDRYEYFGPAAATAPPEGEDDDPQPYIQAQRTLRTRKQSIDGSGGDEREWKYFVDKPLDGGGSTTIINPDKTRSVTVKYGPGTKTAAYSGPGGQTINMIYPFGFKDARVGMPQYKKIYSTSSDGWGGQLLRQEVYQYDQTTLNYSITCTLGQSSVTKTYPLSRTPRLTRTTNIIFEGSGPALAQSRTFGYDLTHQMTTGIDQTVAEVYHYVKIEDNQTALSGDLTQIPLGSLASYIVTSFSTDSDYRNNNILGLPTVVRVKDSNNVIVSQSEMSYDDPMYASGKRGLPTTSRIWDSTKGLSTNPGAYIATHATFDSYGNRTVATDAMGNSTTTTYDSTYHAFPVSVTTAAPDQNGGTHGSTTGFTTSIAYDTPAPSKPPLGLPFSTTDGNGQTTMMEYNDELLRPTKVTAPNGQQTITEYGSGTSEATSWVKVKTQIDENNWSEAKSWYDGIGRTYKSEKVDSQGNVFALTCYDQMGRVEKVSNPFRNVSNPNCSSNLEWTVNDYDDLGRISTITSPDSSVMQTAYGLSTSGLFGTTKTVTDQAGKKRKGITDALGRMVRVIEDPDGQNLPTDYVFDALGNLRKTTQGIQNRYFSHDSLGRLLRAKQPEQDVNTALALPVADSVTGHNQWSVSYSYDDNGNISSTTDARNNTVTATYDRLNRIILRDYSDTAMPDVSFYYDGKGLSQTPTCPNDPTKTCANGKTTKVYSSVSETRYTNFDKMGRLLASQQITDGQTYSFGYSYNLSGALIEETYPSGRVVRNTLNQDGELSVVQSKKNSNAGYYAYATHFSYTPAGMIDKMRLGNGTWETYSYNNRLQVKEIGLGRTDSQTDLLKLEYAYNTTNNHDNNGSMLSQKITVPTVGGNPGFTAEQTYTYDALNRLYSATETISGQQTWKQTFDYDRYGNRRFLTTNNATTTLGSCQTKVCNPEISASDNRFIKDQNGDSVNDYDYDANGNLTLDAENQRFVYDTENRQKQFFKGTNNTSTPNATYHYDGEGKRVKKISETETVIFVYDVGGKLAAEYTTALAQTSQIRYLTMDHLGSTRVLTNERGQVTSRKDYGAFGDETLTPQRAGGLSYSPAQEEIRKGFTGYEKDDESGLDFAQARYYNSNHGRFTSVDPLTASASIRNPQTFNRYSYVLNSPYKFTDPLGLYPADMGVHQTTNGFEARESDRQSRKEYWSAMHPPPPPPPISPPTPILPFVPPAEQNAEPVQDQAGTIEGFVSDMNNSPSKIGQVKGDEADKAMRRLGKTDLFGTPMTTGYFNKNKNRYVYTENGGWIDMVHFLFYASKGYMAKKNGMKHPIGEAMQQGYAQEGWIDGKHSSYSYEDLPTDKFGADFGVNYFDPNSNSTLGEQINSYFVNQLKAAAPSSAPNWNSMPKTDDGKSPPTFTNKTTKPLFTKGN